MKTKTRRDGEHTVTRTGAHPVESMMPQDLHALEALVDRYSLVAVVEALGTVCADKADHLRGNWQDAAAAARWERASILLDRLCGARPGDERQQISFDL